MTRDDGVRTAEEICGGKWDYAVRARAVWLIYERGWDPDDESVTDLSRYEAACDSEIAARIAEYQRMRALAAFSNAGEHYESERHSLKCVCGNDWICPESHFLNPDETSQDAAGFNNAVTS